MQGGTKLYCPKCQDITVCSALPLSEVRESGGQRLYFTEHADINWFRRARECQKCYNTFLTGELDETLIDELASLRGKVSRLTEENKALKSQIVNNANLTQKQPLGLIDKAEQLRSRVSWLYKEGEDIPESVVRDLVRQSVWWLSHPSGKPVRAPKHADNVYHDREQWRIDFGGNAFLPEMAIRVASTKIRRALSRILKGESYDRNLLHAQIKFGLARCVENHKGELYTGRYPSQGDDLVFGVTSIDTKDVADYLLNWSGLDDLISNGQ